MCQDECKIPTTHFACEEDFTCSLSKCACECYKDCKISQYL